MYSITEQATSDDGAPDVDDASIIDGEDSCLLCLRRLEENDLIILNYILMQYL